MPALLKVMLVLASFFASTFLVVKLTGVLSIEQVTSWLELAKNIDSSVLFWSVVTLLFADLFIAIPTLTIMLLSGYFLGATYGAISAITGVMLAGISGYIISYHYGEKLEALLIKDELKREELRSQFNQYGSLMVLFSRALPMLPEVTACMSGLTKMPFLKFITFWSVSAIPYAIIATYAGSISSINNPKPAIITAIILSTIFWSAWFILNRLSKRKIMLQAIEKK
ncbi:VTT domain-containing protein [Colwellia sp. MSW7]|uniref:VTT domain-containing protein n=1 Tax=Colwellia maritima TaxID=2912588 RepID=A0ABS9X3A6_9GAMM|nr:VTT domain-containing protein [Colwellia maritima]MCI2284722.1 VTT domain-containing protein [Colwellia maritima]